MTKAADESKTWSEMAQGAPQPISITGADQHLKALGDLFQTLVNLVLVLPAKKFEDCTLDELSDLVPKLAADNSTPYEIPKLTEIEKNLEISGAGKLISELRQAKPDKNGWPQIFEHAWLSSTLDAVSQQDAEIRGFKGKPTQATLKILPGWTKSD